MPVADEIIVERAVKSLLQRALRRVALRTFGADRIESTIARAADFFDIDLLVAAYRKNGILNYETPEKTGETYLIRTVLPRLLSDQNPILFDVGANVGDISLALRAAFSGATIVAFEPNTFTFARLVENTAGAGIRCVNVGLGAAEGSGELHCYSNDRTSGHSTMYRDMFELYRDYGVPGAADLEVLSFKIRTLDALCSELGVTKIDYLKIDVEGHELRVLEGASELLAANAIGVIQFEFTDCNVLSRTFMRDFFEVLPGFRFYRLAPDRLIPLDHYAARLEVFQFQNILAVSAGIREISV